jgi:hypothetical protein
MNFSTSSNLGDCCWAAQFLRRLGGEHNFYCRADWLGPIREFMSDTNISIDDINNRPADAHDTWIANARFEEKGVHYRHDGDIVGFIVDYFNHLGGVCGTPAPTFTSREQFLFDLPRSNARIPHFDILMVNAQPTSGQVPNFDNAKLNDLIGRLAQHYSVVCTTPTTAKNALVLDASILRIAHYSMRCSMIIGVATGPIWLTFNTQNAGTPRHILLSPQHLDYGPTVPIMNHCSVESIEQALAKDNWI